MLNGTKKKKTYHQGKHIKAYKMQMKNWFCVMKLSRFQPGQPEEEEESEQWCESERPTRRLWSES